jgi:hypothetical protein
MDVNTKVFSCFFVHQLALQTMAIRALLLVVIVNVVIPSPPVHTRGGPYQNLALFFLKKFWPDSIDSGIGVLLG